MRARTPRRVIIVYCLAGLFATAVTWAQTARPSGTLVLRTQAGSVAEEALGKLGLSLKGIGHMSLDVEGGAFHTLIENAFIEALARQGIHTSLKRANDAPNRLLHVAVLDQSVLYAGLSSGEYRREVKTSIEARTVSGDSLLVQHGGRFNRVDVDTVVFREEIGLIPAARDGERTLFDKLVGPVLLIGASFLVIYLFFTVRN